MRRTPAKKDRGARRPAGRRWPVRNARQLRRLRAWQAEEDYEAAVHDLTDRILRGGIIHGHLL
jgi:hypothetical protein